MNKYAEVWSMFSRGDYVHLKDDRGERKVVVLDTGHLGSVFRVLDVTRFADTRYAVLHAGKNMATIDIDGPLNIILHIPYAVHDKDTLDALDSRTEVYTDSTEEQRITAIHKVFSDVAAAITDNETWVRRQMP